MTAIALLINMISYSCVFNLHTDNIVDQLDKGPRKKKATSAYAVYNHSHVKWIAAIVMCYNLAIALAELTWKSMLAVYANGDRSIYTQYAGGQVWYTGILAIFGSLTSSRIRQALSWYSNAIVTPIALVATATPFFVMSLMYSLNFWGAAEPQTYLYYALILGLVQNIIAKATKYVAFDFTKESAYLVLPFEERGQYKAAVDVLVGRAGKSCGAAIQFALLGVFGWIAGKRVVQIDILPAVCMVFVMIMLTWFYSLYKLSASYEKLSAEIDSKNASQRTTAA
jgi:AAA family ATP:ADP antiporter